jgi:AcrR family transcriptional regulator
MIQDRGVKGISMRTLAARLDVSPMGLYWHVPNKVALLELVADSVYAEIETPTTDGWEWQEYVWRVSTESRKKLRQYPGLASFVLRSHSLPEGRRIRHAIVKALRDGGFDDAGAQHAERVLRTFMVGSLVLDDEGSQPRTASGGDGGKRKSPANALVRSKQYEDGLRDVLAGLGLRLSRDFPSHPG